MMFAVGAGVVRWTVAAFTTSPWLLACIQPLHGLTFALFHLAAVRLIVAVAPVRLAATAQALYGTLSVGLAIALVTLASGLLYAHVGGRHFWSWQCSVCWRCRYAPGWVPHVAPSGPRRHRGRPETPPLL